MWILGNANAYFTPKVNGFMYDFLYDLINYLLYIMLHALIKCFTSYDILHVEQVIFT